MIHWAWLIPTAILSGCAVMLVMSAFIVGGDEYDED